MDGKKMIEVKCKGADTLPIDRILEFQGGLKTLSKGNEKKLRNSILKFGFIAPFFVWDDKGEWRLLDGHQRLKTLLKMREEGYDIPLLPVDYIEADSEEDAKRKLLHITSQYGEFSPEGFENFTLDLDGFENIRLTDGEFDISFLRDDDEVKDDNYEIPDEVETDIKVGDIFQIGEHRLMCGDSTDKETVKLLMNGNKADIAFSSPPYNAGTTATETAMGKTTKYNGNEDNKSEAEYIDFLNAYIEQAIEHCEYVFMNVQSISNNKFALIDVLYHNKEIYADTVIWDKIHGQPAMAENVMNSVFEYVHIFSKKANRAVGTVPFRGTVDNILHLQSQRKNKYSNIHNATFSVEFASYFIRNFAKESVLDQFGGTGTTLIACEQLGKTCYMMELDPKYCQVIIDRMRELDGTIEIRRNGELYD